MKPILFNTEMVRAILDGRKTTTRRVIKLPDGYSGHPVFDPIGFMYAGGIKRPTYSVGDVLYVRETFGYDNFAAFNKIVYYKVNDNIPHDCEIHWHPSIHMSKEAARIFLKVTNVRVERLQEITEEQAAAEGCITFSDKTGDGKFDDVLEFDLTARFAFIELWNGTLKKDSTCTWAHNPFVWVIEFERCEKLLDGGTPRPFPTA